MMVPFADFINHHNNDGSYELIKKDWKPKLRAELAECVQNEIKLEDATYYREGKFDPDMSMFYGPY
jgi:hypothetical protein